MARNVQSKVLFMARPERAEPWLQDVRAALGAAYDVVEWTAEESFGEQVAGAVAVADLLAPLTPDMIDEAAAAGVELWQIVGTGFDHIDLERARAHGLPVANTPGPYSAPAVAEHALMLMLTIARRFSETQAHLAQGRFGRVFADELNGKTLGILGVGASGRALARIAQALGMKVLGIGIRPPEGPDAAGIEYVGGLDALDTMLARADYVSTHVPLTPETEALFDAGRFAAMKPSGVIINVARGGIVDQDALVAALGDGTICAAGLDVFALEPIDQGDPLLALPNVVATPHVAGNTVETSQRRGAAAAANIKRVRRGESPLDVVG